MRHRREIHPAENEKNCLPLAEPSSDEPKEGFS
jgi:hypothetical protein